MRKPRYVTLTVLTAATLCGCFGARVLRAQQDGVVAYPNVYRVQFENDWVQVIRVSVPVNAFLADHTHPPGLMVHLYLNDAGPLTFIHRQSAAGTIARPAVSARSYRVGRTRAETHAVSNVGGGPSDYLRIEIKTLGTESMPHRILAPPVRVQTTSVLEVTNAQFRVTRITVAPHEAFDITVGATDAALVVALTEGVSVDGAQALTVGQERFLDGGRRAQIRPQGLSPVQLLLVDLLTRPAAAPPQAP